MILDVDITELATDCITVKAQIFVLNKNRVQRNVRVEKTHEGLILRVLSTLPGKD